MSKSNESNQELMAERQRCEEIVEHVLWQAKQLGVDEAEVAASFDMGFSTTVRMGDVEPVEFNRDKGFGITLYCGHRKGSATSSDTSPEALKSCLEKAWEIARQTGEDPCSGLADPKLMAYDYPDLQLFHPWDLNPQQAIDLCKQCEKIGLDYHEKIINSDGASLSSHTGIQVYGNTHGFLGGYPSSRHSFNCVLIGKDGEGMQRDYYYTVARDKEDLESLEAVGKKAGERTISRLQPRKLKTQKAPVIFYHEVASSLFSHFIAAIRGSSLYRKASFLVDHLGQTIFPKHITIDEEPHLMKGLASAPFDHEGVRTASRCIVSEGVLQGYVLASYGARKLGMQSTGNAGGIHNLKIKNSGLSFQELLAEMGTGFLLTEVIGPGVNIITGDYSRGASGFWVEDGKIQYPVKEATIAGTLPEMFQAIVAIADDIDPRSSIKTGSVLIDSMMIGGE